MGMVLLILRLLFDSHPIQDIVKTEMAYMGYHDSESYGLTWKVDPAIVLGVTIGSKRASVQQYSF